MSAMLPHPYWRDAPSRLSPSQQARANWARYDAMRGVAAIAVLPPIRRARAAATLEHAMLINSDPCAAPSVRQAAWRILMTAAGGLRLPPDDPIVKKNAVKRAAMQRKRAKPDGR